MRCAQAISGGTGQVLIRLKTAQQPNTSMPKAISASAELRSPLASGKFALGGMTVAARFTADRTAGYFAPAMNVDRTSRVSEFALMGCVTLAVREETPVPSRLAAVDLGANDNAVTKTKAIGNSWQNLTRMCVKI